MPILDGTLLPRDPLASLKNGGAAWCDIVIGVTREEYAAFSISNPSLDDLTEEELRSIFERELGRGAEEALAKIRSSRVPATPRAVLCDLHSAQTFINDSLAIAATQSGLGRNAFAYMFDWQSPTAGLGACHCIDLPFLFGNFDVWKAAPMLKGANWQEVEELSRIFRGAVAAFAENGNPNKAGLPGWPAFKSDRAVLHFDRQIRAFGWIA